MGAQGRRSRPQAACDEHPREPEPSAWIEERGGRRRRRLQGWSFDINECEVQAYVPKRNAFEPLTLDLAAHLQGA
jgi:hypothetical protein